MFNSLKIRHPFQYWNKKIKNKQSDLTETDELVILLRQAIKVTTEVKESKKPIKNFTRETAIKIIKGDFEKHYGISLEKFISEYKDIMETCPEKLI